MCNLVSQLRKALYFGGSSWSISWLNYVLGPMKCFGKQHPYPSEIERLNKEMKEQKFKDVIKQAKINADDLEVLDEKFKFESKNISALHSNIEKMSQAIHDDSENWKQEIQFLKNDLKKVEQQLIKRNHLEIINVHANMTNIINELEKDVAQNITEVLSELAAASKNISTIMQSNIQNLTQVIQRNSKEWKQEVKFVKTAGQKQMYHMVNLWNNSVKRIENDSFKNITNLSTNVTKKTSVRP